MQSGASNERDFTFVLMPLVFVLAIAIEFYTLPYSDLTWMMLGVQRMLSGAKLYQDVLEPNPPLIFWLYTPVVMLAEAFSWPLVVTLKMATIALAGISLWLCAVILSHSILWQGSKRRLLLLTLAGVLLFTPDAERIFSQREHLMIILVFPYVFLHLPSLQNQTLAKTIHILAGIAAGIGFCIKPYFLVIWFFLLSYRWPLKSWLSDLAIIAVGLIYAASIVCFVPEYIPWAGIMLKTYPYFNVHETLLDKAIELTAIALAGAAIIWKFGLLKLSKGLAWRSDVRYFLWLAASAYLEVLLQCKTWPYLFYPLIVFGAVGATMAFLLKPINDIFAFVFAAWLFYPLTPLSDNVQDLTRQNYVNMLEMLAPYDKARSVYFVTELPLPAPFYTDTPPLRYISRFNYMNYLLMGIMQVAVGSCALLAKV